MIYRHRIYNNLLNLYSIFYSIFSLPLPMLGTLGLPRSIAHFPEFAAAFHWMADRPFAPQESHTEFRWRLGQFGRLVKKFAFIGKLNIGDEFRS